MAVSGFPEIPEFLGKVPAMRCGKPEPARGGLCRVVYHLKPRNPTFDGGFPEVCSARRVSDARSGKGNPLRAHHQEVVEANHRFPPPATTAHRSTVTMGGSAGEGKLPPANFKI